MKLSGRKLVAIVCLLGALAGQSAIAKMGDPPVVLLQAHTQLPLDGPQSVNGAQSGGDQSNTQASQAANQGANEPGRLPSAPGSTQPHSSKAQLQATVSAVVVPDRTPSQLVDDCVQMAVQRHAMSPLLEKGAARYHGPIRKTVASIGDLAQFATAYKGFQASSEAADVILDEKMRLNSKPAVDLFQQKQHDQLHVKVVETMMQLAEGFGIEDDAKRRKEIRAGCDELEQLVGEDDARKLFQQLKNWSQSVRRAQWTASQESFDVVHVQDHTDRIVLSAIKTDPVVVLVKERLHKYNHHSTFMRATAKVVNTSLSVLMFSPSVISPAAQIALMGFLVCTGGPEEAKLLKSLYLDRRIEIRYAMLNRESALAVNNYNQALMSKNSVLAAYCMATAEHMAGKESAQQILADDSLITVSKSSKIDVSVKNLPQHAF